MQSISRREFVKLASSAALLLRATPLRAQTPRVRREIRTLGPAERDALVAGVAAMRALPKADFRSWAYQAGVHGALDSSGVPDAATYWNQCQHGTLHFLSWHRWELLFIEEMLRLLSDQCEFTLPYWDYLANGFLPEALRVPSDASNPLFDGSRSTALNDGSGALSGLSDGALALIPFAAFSSSLYGNPHSAVHGLVGGNMQSVPTAALDPVFWLHHCNIDRYWECWIRQGGGRANPGSPWADQTFPFRTLSGRRDAIVGDAVRTADLGYTYDNLPCAGVVAPGILERLREFRMVRIPVRPPPPIPDPWPWKALAAFGSFTLDGRPTAVVVSRADLARADLAAAAGRGDSAIAVTLQDVELSPAGRAGGFFFELWLAPSARRIESGGGLEGAESIGSFSAFDVSVHAQHPPGHQGHPGRDGGASLAFALPEASRRVLTAGKEDPAVVLVRHGLIDESGRPRPFDERAELLRIGALRIEAAR